MSPLRPPMPARWQRALALVRGALSGGALIACALVGGVLLAPAAPAAAQSGPICSTFDSGLDGFGPCSDAPNVTVNRVTDADGLDSSNPYMRLIDRPNASRVCSTDPKYVGNWLEKMNRCGKLCYDFRVFNSGYPPTAITPSISIVGGGGRATYHAGFQVAIGDKEWHHICAPIEDGAAPPPGIAGGQWSVTGASWHQIITNVTMVQLPIDFTSQPSEEVGYDNICMTPGECENPPPPPPPEIKGCLEGTKVAVACKGGGVYTVTLSGGSFPGDTITLAAQTPGVSVAPAQQPWAPTMTFTLSGASAGQTVTLFASATKVGGGSVPGTDACCSGEIKIVLPDCPKDKPVDVGIEKEGGTTPAQRPDYAFTLTITNHGADFAGASNITVTDVLPPGMTFDTVTPTPPGDWSCPPSVPAGGTLVCTYTGSGPVGTGVIGTVAINATAGGSAPYPPVENCATVAVSGGFTDTDASNNRDCVTVTKKGDTAEVIVTKEVEYIGPLTLPELTYPISVQCGSMGQVFNLQNTQSGSMGNIPLNTACQITETPPTPPVGACPPDMNPVWTTTFNPPVPVTLTAPVTRVTVHNKLACEPKGDGQTGELIVTKEVEYIGPLTLPELTYPISVQCGSMGQVFNLQNTQSGSMGNIPLNTACQITETPPTPPAGACPPDMNPVWTTTFNPPVPVTLTTPVTNVTVHNKLACEQKGTPGTLEVVKTVTNETDADLTGATFSATAICGGTSTPLSLTTASAQSLANLAAGTTCTVSEAVPPVPASGCGTGRYPAWEPATISPASVTIPAAGTATVTVANKLICERGGYIAVTKEVVNNTQADVSGASFAVSLNCQGAGPRNVTLTPGATVLLHNIVVGVTCTGSETLPAAPTSGCPAGSAPAWGTPVYTPASVTSVAGAGPTMTVRNTLDCAPTATGKQSVTPVVLPPVVPPSVVPPSVVPPPARKIACPAPLEPNAAGDKCVCASGTVLRGKRCVATGPRQTGTPTVVPPPRKIVCRAPMVPNAKGDGCDCGPGTVRRGGRCVAPVRCVKPAFPNARGTACLCPKDMERRGDTCVRKKVEEPRVRHPNVLQILPGLGRHGSGDGNRNQGGHGDGGKGSGAKP